MDHAEIETAVGGWGVLTATGVPGILEEYHARAGLVDMLPGEAANGLTLLTDDVHLNDRAAAVVADLIEGWLTAPA